MDSLLNDVWIKIIIGVFGVVFPFVWGSFQRRKIGQAEIFHREAHNLNLFKALSDANEKLQIAAASVLIERLEKKPTNQFERSERSTIIRTLISVTKDEGASSELCKFVADNVPRLLGVLDRPKARLGARSPMTDFDWQGARFDRGYWRGIDARGVDFFGAHLVEVGMRNAHLSDAILKQADMRDCVLVGADLQGADLRGADLRGANLESAVLREAKLNSAKYDHNTRFPDGFDPGAALMMASSGAGELAA